MVGISSQLVDDGEPTYRNRTHNKCFEFPQNSDSVVVINAVTQNLGEFLSTLDNCGSIQCRDFMSESITFLSTYYITERTSRERTLLHTPPNLHPSIYCTDLSWGEFGERWSVDQVSGQSVVHEPQVTHEAGPELWLHPLMLQQLPMNRTTIHYWTFHVTDTLDLCTGLWHNIFMQTHYARENL